MLNLTRLVRSTIRYTHHRIAPTATFNNRQFHDEFNQPPKTEVTATKLVPTAVASRYQVFKDDDASVILDVDEERQRLSAEGELDEMVEQTLSDIYAGLNMERGLNGVFEIDDLVEVLRKDNADDIFVCSVPKGLKYVDFICVVTGRSLRHRKAMAQFVRKMFKLKRRPGDVIPKIEGENSPDWLALDLGNIALHIFSSEARKLYDLESLWSLGCEFDPEFNKPNDALVELYEKNSIYLGDLTPNNSNSQTSPNSN